MLFTRLKGHDATGVVLLLLKTRLLLHYLSQYLIGCLQNLFFLTCVWFIIKWFLNFHSSNLIKQCFTPLSVGNLARARPEAAKVILAGYTSIFSQSLCVDEFLVQNLAQVGIKIYFDLSFKTLIWLFYVRVSYAVWMNHHHVVIQMKRIFSTAVEHQFGHVT